MSKTNAERQADYRRRRWERNERDGEICINVYLKSQAAFALKRLASHQGISQKAILEMLITAADDQASRAMDIDSEEFKKHMLLSN